MFRGFSSFFQVGGHLHEAKKNSRTGQQQTSVISSGVKILHPFFTTDPSLVLEALRAAKQQQWCHEFDS